MPDIVIPCILTGREVPTGLTTDDIIFETLPQNIEMSLICPVCYGTHPWTPKEAWVKGKKKRSIRENGPQ
jgi:hypothetical protein